MIDVVTISAQTTPNRYAYISFWREPCYMRFAHLSIDGDPGSVVQGWLKGTGLIIVAKLKPKINHNIIIIKYHQCKNL